jgi:hypothetical protein
MNPQQKNKNIIIWTALIIIVLAVAYFVWPKPTTTTTPDQTTTGTVSSTAGWKTYTDPTSGASFKYPTSISTKYITTQNWPPKLAISNAAFSCTVSGTQPGQTIKKSINGNGYCENIEAEGAAGSTYLNYLYSFPVNNKVAIITFTLREVQCLNYSNPEQTTCTNERSAFNIDKIVDAMAQTVNVK